jgi:hypothetical protein
VVEDDPSIEVKEEGESKATVEVQASKSLRYRK